MRNKFVSLKRMTSGQTLIEVLVALGVAIAIITGITIAVLSALSNTQFTKNQNEATAHAASGIETVRSLRDSDPNFFALDEIYYCLPYSSTTLTSRGPGGCGQNVGIFVREVEIEQNALACGNTTRAEVAVSWADAKCTNRADIFCHQVKLASCFGRIARIQLP